VRKRFKRIKSDGDLPADDIVPPLTKPELVISSKT
jgi:hypothetical protein